MIIGTGQKDLFQLSKAASMFWFKDRSGLSMAPVLGEIVTDCESTHDEVLLSFLSVADVSLLVMNYASSSFFPGRR